MKIEEITKLSQKATTIFEEAVTKYHYLDTTEQLLNNPYEKGSMEALLYKKNWIDTVQWHYEDLIRDPKIDPKEGMHLKRKIDASNQARTDLVEELDQYFFSLFEKVNPLEGASHNTESPAWAIDRLSILVLKIYHMQEQIMRTDVTKSHVDQCQAKNQILLAQQEDLSNAIDQLLLDLSAGKKFMKVYKQMKMYNDENLNPVLYDSHKTKKN